LLRSGRDPATSRFFFLFWFFCLTAKGRICRSRALRSFAQFPSFSLAFGIALLRLFFRPVVSSGSTLRLTLCLSACACPVRWSLDILFLFRRHSVSSSFFSGAILLLWGAQVRLSEIFSLFIFASIRSFSVRFWVFSRRFSGSQRLPGYALPLRSCLGSSLASSPPDLWGFLMETSMVFFWFGSGVRPFSRVWRVFSPKPSREG